LGHCQKIVSAASLQAVVVAGNLGGVSADPGGFVLGVAGLLAGRGGCR